MSVETVIRPELRLFVQPHQHLGHPAKSAAYKAWRKVFFSGRFAPKRLGPR